MTILQHNCLTLRSLFVLALLMAMFSPFSALAIAEKQPSSSKEGISPSSVERQTDDLQAPLEALPQSEFIDSVIDLPHNYLSEKFVSIAADVDHFFANDRDFQESNNSVLQFDLSRMVDRTGANNFVPTFRAKLHFPGTQNRLSRWGRRIHLLLESNPDKNLAGAGVNTKKKNTIIFDEVTTPDSYGAALRFESRADSAWRLSADAGLKLVGASDVLNLGSTSLDPFMRSRASVTAWLGATQLQLAESLFWFNTIGVGENTQFDADYNFAEFLLFRASSSATWLHNTQNFDLRQDLDLFHTLNDKASLLYQLSATGVSQPQIQVSEYVALILYRKRVHRDWVYLDLSPQLHYPRLLDYQLNSQFVIRLEVLFSK